MSNYSWSDAQRRRTDAAQQAADSALTQQQLRERIERDRQEITDQIVKPFLQAMATAGNPGSQRHQSLRGVRTWNGTVGRTDYTVSTDGSWRCHASFPRGYQEEAHHLCESTPGGFLNQHLLVGQAFQDALLQLLIQHRVPIPRS